MITAYVVTKVEQRGVTRVVLGCSAAHDFLAWLVANGNHASLRMVHELPHREPEEQARAIALCQEWFNSIEV